MRRVPATILPLVATMMIACGSYVLAQTSTTAPATAPSKPPLTSDYCTISDYVTVLLAPKTQEVLAATAGQIEQFNTLRDRFELMLSNSTAHTVASRNTTMMIGAARRILEINGQKVRDLLTADQDKQVQSMFEKKSLKPIEIRAAQASDRLRAGPRSGLYGELVIVYTRYQEPKDKTDVALTTATTAPATVATQAPVPVATQPAPAAKAPDLAAIPAPAMTPAAGTSNGKRANLSKALAEKIKAALGGKTYESSPLVGGAFAKNEFTEMPATGGVLIGFRYGLGRFGNNDTISFIQAIFLTPTGEVLGQPHGKPTDHLVDIKARPGYAVGGISIRGGGGFDAFTLTFMRLNDAGLDVSDSYAATRIGGPGGSERTFNSGSIPIIGICGKEDPQHKWVGLGVIFEAHTPDSTPVAK